MKRNLVILAINIMLSSIVSSQDIMPVTAPKPTVAVMDLEAKEGVSLKTTQLLSDFLRNLLHKQEVFELVSRENLQSILKEQKLQMTECTSDACIVKVGNLIGAKKMFAGSIGKVGNTYLVTIKLFDVETGRMEKIESDRCAGCAEDALLDSIDRVAAKISGKEVKVEKTIFDEIQISKIVIPSVVCIFTDKIITAKDSKFGLSKTLNKKQQGLGSGLIVDEKGCIITNWHVIRDVDTISVFLKDNPHKYEAKVIGSDPKTDLALIKIDAERPLSVVNLGDSGSIKLGEKVMAIGNPTGVSATVTTGIVSGKGSRGSVITQYEDFIQTTAEINSGNSGGPLVNMNAEVIGINTFIDNPEVFGKTGFAIPVNIAKHVFNHLWTEGKVVRGYLGVVLQPLDEDLAKSYGLKDTKGALVSQVMPNTPAMKAGLKEEDIIIKFDGVNIEDMRDLQKNAADSPVGKTIRMVIWRKKKEVWINLMLEEMPSEQLVE